MKAKDLIFLAINPYEKWPFYIDVRSHNFIAHEWYFLTAKGVLKNFPLNTIN